jgi:hypothetical protein
VGAALEAAKGLLVAVHERVQVTGRIDGERLARATAKAPRPKKTDAFRARIDELFVRYPDITAHSFESMARMRSCARVAPPATWLWQWPKVTQSRFEKPREPENGAGNCATA